MIATACQMLSETEPTVRNGELSHMMRIHFVTIVTILAIYPCTRLPCVAQQQPTKQPEAGASARKAAAPSQDKISALKAEIKTFRDEQEAQRKTNGIYHITLTIVALVCAFGVVVAGVQNHGKIAAILGGLIALFVGVENAFPFRHRSEYYRVMVAESDILLDEATYRLDSPEQFDTVLNTLRVLRKRQEPTSGEDDLKGLLADVKATSAGNIGGGLR
jgi:hypothetical protein